MKLRALFAALLGAALAAGASAAAEEVNLYTDRQAALLRPVLQAFEKESGIAVNVLFAKTGLLQRIKSEGAQSPADVALIVDLGQQAEWTRAGVVQNHAAPDIIAAVPPGYANDTWVAVTRRARILFVSAEMPDVAAQKLDYAALAAPAQRGKVCMRSGRNTYNIGLIADMIGRLGQDAARDWLAGVKRNLARRPQGKDRTQIKEVAAGRCDIGVANSYYYFQLLRQDKTRAAMQRVRPVVPPQAHINATGIALAAHAPNRASALKLMRFLLSRNAQEIYARANGEFPARVDAELPPDMASFAAALARAAPPADIARHRAAASRLVEQLEFDR